MCRYNHRLDPFNVRSVEHHGQTLSLSLLSLPLTSFLMLVLFPCLNSFLPVFEHWAENWKLALLARDKNKKQEDIHMQYATLVCRKIATTVMMIMLFVSIINLERCVEKDTLNANVLSSLSSVLECVWFLEKVLLTVDGIESREQWPWVLLT